MSRALTSLLATVVAAGLVLVGGAGPAAAGHPPTMLGPGDARVSDIGGRAVIRYSKHGPVYISGKHNSHLRVTHVKGKHSIRFRDTRTGGIKGSLPDRCSRERVRTGISVRCKVAPKFRGPRRMFIQVWPRLGHDYVDGRTLSKQFRLWVLTDDGRDVVHGGAGADFVNGAMGADRMWGGPGRDWLRGGPARDRIHGGPGKDRIATG